MNHGQTRSYAHQGDWSKSSDWLKFRRWWLANNRPTEDKWYLCGICGQWVQAEEVTLDHIEPRTADNIFDPSNIQPSHGYCNYRKGSRRVDPVVSGDTYEFLDILSKM